SDMVLKLKGLLFNGARLTYDLRASLRAPSERLADFLNLPFTWGGRLEAEGRVSNTGGPLSVRADLHAPALRLNGMPLGMVDGPLALGSGFRGTLRLSLRGESGPVEKMDLEFGPGYVGGTARGFHVDPIIKEFKIPWPVRSPVDGTFRVENQGLRVHAALVDDPASPPASGRFAWRGPIDLTWNGPARNLTFSSDKIESAFGVLKAKGQIGIGRDIEVAVDGDISDVRMTREFLELILNKPLRIPEIRGRGRAEFKILGRFAAPQVKIAFSLAPAGFAAFDAAAADGLIEIAGGGVTGVLQVNDPDVKGEIKLEAKDGNFEIRTKIEDGRVESILAALKLNLPLKGRASGDLTVSSRPSGVGLKGTIKAGALEAAGQRLTGVRTGLEWSSASSRLALTDLETGLFNGKVSGNVRLGLKDRSYEADIKAEGLDLAAAAKGPRGTAGFSLSGRGTLDNNPAEGAFTVHGLGFGAFGPADASGTVGVGFPNGRAMVRLSGKLDPGGNEIEATFMAPRAEEGFLVTARGRLLTPELIVPWKGIRAETDYLFDIRGGGEGVHVDGAVDIKGSVLPIPGFPHALTDFAALVRVQNNKATLRSFQGRLAGGDIQGTGEVRFGSRGLEGMDLSLGGKSLALALLEGTRVLTDVDLRLEGTSGRLALSGGADIKQFTWRREFSDPIAFAFPPRRPGAAPSPFEGLALDIRLRTEEGVLVENSMGRIQGGFDLTLSGTVEAPVVLGVIEARRGEIYFQDRTFRVIQGRLSFFNPSSIEPYLDFRGETFLKDYRVTFSLTGRLDRLRPEFASSPPLPSEDVLALLALGESFKRTYAYEASASMGTGSLLSSQLTEAAKKRAEKLFALDSFRIDPFVLGASTEMTARLTVGKKISSNVVLLYSTNLTSQREDLVRLEWDFSQNFALVAMRDERGRLSIDAKVRKRF
ncbi:MAG: translocation/assembly module TamB domain-containing protein, partial [Acidobacteriota bacterium]|nr:translocation/assembly module TamB domain-containing protein [Acidobacteriota bacterium]